MGADVYWAERESWVEVKTRNLELGIAVRSCLTWPCNGEQPNRLVQFQAPSTRN